MPTLFSDCIECTDEKNDLEIMEILIAKKIPTEIAIKIVKCNYNYFRCDICEKSLCQSHAYKSHQPIGTISCSYCIKKLWCKMYQNMLNPV